MRNQYCNNCLRHGEEKLGPVEHHPHYDADITTPSCERCHTEITSLNCEAARSFIPRKRLSTSERMAIFKKWFVDGFSVFVRGPQNMGKLLDVAPETVKDTLKWLGLMERARKSMNIAFPHKGIMTYEINTPTGRIRVLHLHSSADEEKDDPRFYDRSLE